MRSFRLLQNIFAMLNPSVSPYADCESNSVHRYIGRRRTKPFNENVTRVNKKMQMWMHLTREETLTSKVYRFVCPTVHSCSLRITTVAGRYNSSLMTHPVVSGIRRWTGSPLHVHNAAIITELQTSSNRVSSSSNRNRNSKTNHNSSPVRNPL